MHREIFLLDQYYLNHQIEDDEIFKARTMHGREVCRKVLAENLKETDYYVDIRVDRIILEWT
jgi:hypothetical protein